MPDLDRVSGMSVDDDLAPEAVHPRQLEQGLDALEAAGVPVTRAEHPG